jgi:hypothetical protein
MSTATLGASAIAVLPKMRPNAVWVYNFLDIELSMIQYNITSNKIQNLSTSAIGNCRFEMNVINTRK